MNFSMMTRVVGLLAGAIVLAGCESKPQTSEPVEPLEPPKPQNEFFISAEPRSVGAFAAAQAAEGARHDAMLQPQHFDGDGLNSLGRDKLDLMTADRTDADGQLTIYMNFAEAEGMEARRGAVTSHLAERGIDEAKIKFLSGPNPHARSAAAPHLARLPRTESGLSDEAAGTGMTTDMSNGVTTNAK